MLGFVGVGERCRWGLVVDEGSMQEDKSCVVLGTDLLVQDGNMGKG